VVTVRALVSILGGLESRRVATIPTSVARSTFNFTE
jgi:hypothetical protein